MYKIIGADQKEYGPISADQIRQWISEGRINSNTRMQAEGTGVWKRAGEFTEFTAALTVTPAPLHAAPISMPPATAPVKSSLMAIWAMITGILSLITCCWLLGPIPIVLGCVALAQIKKDPGQTGAGFAITGIVLGVVSVILMIIAIVIAIAVPQFWVNLQNSLQQQ